MIALRGAASGLAAAIVVLLVVVWAVFAMAGDSGAREEAGAIVLRLGFAVFIAAAAGAAAGTWQAAVAGASTPLRAATAGAAGVALAAVGLAVATAAAGPLLEGLLKGALLLVLGAGGAALGAGVLARRLE